MREILLVIFAVLQFVFLQPIEAADVEDLDLDYGTGNQLSLLIIFPFKGVTKFYSLCFINIHLGYNLDFVVKHDIF